MGESVQLTDLLQKLTSGDSDAAAEVIPIIYEELRRLAAYYMASERPGHMLRTTALVHEAYLRLVDQRQSNWRNRAHFYGAAAQVMRRILVDHARARQALKRGGDRLLLPLDEPAVFSGEETQELVLLDEALNKLAEMSFTPEPDHRTAVLRRSHRRRNGRGYGHLPKNRQAGLECRQGMAAPGNPWQHKGRGHSTMTPERWSQVSEVFKAALEFDSPDRNDFLRNACADDPELQREVESLLDEHGRAGDFLNHPANAQATDALRQASAECEDDPYLGLTLKNRYQIEARLARGGQALVYRARDVVVMSRPVVIKILHSAGQNVWRGEFLQEMEALSRIDHPGIVGVLDTGELADGIPFLVIQYVHGTTLRQELGKGPLDRLRAASILLQMGKALDAAHSAGIAHRDLKPENIMLQPQSDGSDFVKLIDFGIANVDESSFSPNDAAIVAGTARYMAPEQFQGENSSASDIYALGLIACEMLSGEPELHRLKAPRKVRQLILGALAYKPKDRPQRAGEFTNELAEALMETSGSKPAGRLRGLHSHLDRRCDSFGDRGHNRIVFCPRTLDGNRRQALVDTARGNELRQLRTFPRWPPGCHCGHRFCWEKAVMGTVSRFSRLPAFGRNRRRRFAFLVSRQPLHRILRG